MFVPKKLLAEFFLIKKILINSLSQNNFYTKSCRKQIAPLSLRNLNFKKKKSKIILFRYHYHTYFSLLKFCPKIMFILKSCANHNVSVQNNVPKLISLKICLKTNPLKNILYQIVPKQHLPQEKLPQTNFSNRKFCPNNLTKTKCSCSY